MIIAIDGPSGAGKSSVAKAVAAHLGFSCLDTGAMYRAVAWKALHDGVSLNDSDALETIARECPIEFGIEPGEVLPQKVYIDGVEVTNEIRTAEIDKAVSPVSSTASVRKALVSQQQRIGSAGNYVVEGRDIGTVVFPSAEVKVFLTASPEERARRRVKQNEERGIGLTNFDDVLADIMRRDQVDSSRDTAPLQAASDAHLLDSTDISIEEVIHIICSLAHEAGA